MAFCFQAVALILGSAILAQSAPPIPITGPTVPALRGIDQVVTNFMARYSVPGGVFGLVRNGRLICVRGYGYADVEAGQPVQPDSLFRIASLSKSITAAAVLTLVDQGKLRLDDHAFDLLHYAAPTFPGAAVDPRLKNITVRQLLNHSAGWNRDTALNPRGGVGFDPTVNWTVEAAKVMGSSAPADATTIVRWMMGQPLQFDPGTEYQYSNFGYTVLGRVIEKLSGQTYEQFAKQMLAPLGITRMRIAGSRASERSKGEVKYYDYPGAALVRSIFPQDAKPVPLPYNFSYSSMDSHGGWLASAIDLLRFVTVIDGRASPPDILSPACISNMISRPTPPWRADQEPFYGMGWMVRDTSDNWWHTGSLPGTAAELVRAGNGFTWVLLFNFRADRDDHFFPDLDRLGWSAIASVTNWPDIDLFTDPNGSRTDATQPRSSALKP